MADLEFETRLDRMFADTPVFEDREAFARQVVNRLERGWSMRQWAIGVAGFIGGLTGVWQLVRSGLLVRAEDIPSEPMKLLSHRVMEASRAGLEFSSVPVGGEVMWAAVGLSVLAVTFVAMRAVGEL
ncbi:hypothetical protein [Caulobacter sp. NIBR2454]|uniref:hypothetical protein n=1 Tax=Caulobacter sp. NIBR2454 TaxID=3015996 RepID=UPI0022B70F99|nr:hypothetical protein [Caulobacter sp. NIBR2454]